GERSKLIDQIITRPELLGFAAGGIEHHFVSALFDTLPSDQELGALARLLAERGLTEDLRPALVDLADAFGIERALSCRLLNLGADRAPRNLFGAPLSRWELSSKAEEELGPAEWGRVASMVAAKSGGPDSTHVSVMLKSGGEATLSVTT